MNTYRDPRNKTQRDFIYKEIQQIRNADEAYNFVKKYKPDWIVSECDDFADEYVKYKENWKKIYSATFQPKRKVLLGRQCCLCHCLFVCSLNGRRK